MPARTEESFKDYVSSELQKSKERMDMLCLSMAAIEAEQTQSRDLLAHGTATMTEVQLEQMQSRILLANNTATTNRVEANVADLSRSISEMLDVFISWQGAMRVIDMIGKLAKPVGYIALAISSVVGVWVAIKTGMGIK